MWFITFGSSRVFFLKVEAATQLKNNFLLSAKLKIFTQTEKEVLRDSSLFKLNTHANHTHTGKKSGMAASLNSNSFSSQHLDLFIIHVKFFTSEKETRADFLINTNDPFRAYICFRPLIIIRRKQNLRHDLNIECVTGARHVN